MAFLDKHFFLICAFCHRSRLFVNSKQNSNTFDIGIYRPVFTVPIANTERYRHRKRRDFVRDESRSSPSVCHRAKRHQRRRETAASFVPCADDSAFRVHCGHRRGRSVGLFHAAAVQAHAGKPDRVMVKYGLVQ